MLITNQTKRSAAAVILGLAAISLVFASCNVSDSSGSGGLEVDEWLINENEVVDGGPRIDGIPSIEIPTFATTSSTDDFQDNRRIAALRIGDELRAYPHQIMDQHEIVNHQVNGRDVTLSFCPLTGTSIGIDREQTASGVEFGVSGLLFRNNLIMYDRNTGSTWSQMQLRSVGGEFAGTDAETIQVIETTWGQWKEMYPDSQVMTKNTGFNRNYDIFVYGSDYTTNNNDILFPIKNADNRLQRKERVHALLPTGASEESDVKAYPLSNFGPGITLIEDQFMGEEVLLVGSSDLDLASSFQLETAFEQELQLEAVDGELPIVMRDQHGNGWDIFGYAIDGPNQGQRLTAARGYTGYWFALADFYPGIELYNE
jgi:hypothetical protein